MAKGKPEKPLFETPASSAAIMKTKTKKIKTKAKLVKKPKSLSLVMQMQQVASVEETPNIEGYEVRAEHMPAIMSHGELGNKPATLTAQELLDKPLEELEKDIGKREAQNLLKNMRIITAIMLGKNKNKELSRMLNTDKSFTSKQIKSLEEQGLIKRDGEGKETKYEVDRFNVMKFLESKIVIKWSKPQKDNAQSRGEQNGNTRPKENS
jgi:predicted transcriptional regulator